MVSIQCARKLYQKPFSYKCEAVGAPPTGMRVLKMDKVAGIQGAEVEVKTKCKNEKKPLVKGT